MMTWLLSSVILSVSPEAKGLEIARAADAADADFGLETVVATMTIEGATGKTQRRVFRITTTDREGDRSLIELIEPARHRGMRVLTVTAADDSGETVYIRLPRHGRTRRIVGRKRTGRFLGSELTFEDLGSRRHARYRHRWLRDERIGDTTAHVVETIPRDPDTGYRSILLWREAKTYRLLKVVWTGESGQTLKTGEFTDWRAHGRYWRAARYVVTNAVTGRKTTLEFSDRTIGGEPPADAFTPEGLER